MIKPGIALGLWWAIAAMILLNNMIGDTWIAASLSTRAVEWYKALVPVPYVALIAVIHARRTAGPDWLQAAVVAALNWPVATMVADYLYSRVTFGDDLTAFFDRFAVQWGAPYPLLIVTLFAAPLLAGAAIAKGKRSG
jgi:hypothetical protein